MDSIINCNIEGHFLQQDNKIKNEPSLLEYKHTRKKDNAVV